MAKRSTAELTKYVRLLAEAGVMKKPRWLESVERFPPVAHNTKQQGKRPPRIEYPEDQFVHDYYGKNPAARLEPIDLGSFQPSSARTFAFRQLELMEEHGMSRRDARQQAEREFRTGEMMAFEGNVQSVGEKLIEAVQKEEELHLQEALETFRERHGGDLSKLVQVE